MKVHDQFCRCRVCKPPLPPKRYPGLGQRRRGPSNRLVAISTGIAIALMIAAHMIWG